MRLIRQAAGIMFGLTVAATVACGSPTEPDQDNVLVGRWEGTSGTGVAYVYIFTATGEDATNPRTGNVARTYTLAFTTTPGGSGSTTAWYEAPNAYWGGTSVGTITDATTMRVQAQNLAPFTMRKQP